MTKTNKTESTVVANIPTMRAAEMVGIQDEVTFDPTLLPKEFSGVTLEVVNSGFNPSAVWNSPGDFVAGVYTGKEERVGPNGAALYNFEASNGKPFSVWGTSVLDRTFAIAEKSGLIKPGRVVMIMFSGTTPSKFAENPTKLFQIGVVDNLSGCE